MTKWFRFSNFKAESGWRILCFIWDYIISSILECGNLLNWLNQMPTIEVPSPYCIQQILKYIFRTYSPGIRDPEIQRHGLTGCLILFRHRRANFFVLSLMIMEASPVIAAFNWSILCSSVTNRTQEYVEANVHFFQQKRWISLFWKSRVQIDLFTNVFYIYLFFLTQI